MSLSFGSTKKKEKSNQQQDPWEPTIPYLTDYLAQVGQLGNGGATAGQTDAYNQLSGLYGGGNPFSQQITNIANETAQGVPSMAGTVTDNFQTSRDALMPYVSGQNLDLSNNKYLQDMLTQVGSDAQNRVNAQFAGAGRDLSGMNQQSVGRGVTQAQLPLLLQQFNQEQQNQINAANQLTGNANSAATTAQGLNQASLAGKASALPMFDAALASQTWGPENQFNLEQIFKDLPAGDLANLGSLLFPVAQLGQQQEGTSKGSSSSFGFGAKLLSDERMKENLKKVGALADGTPIYSFTYKGEDTTRIGVSAQDMEEINPDAVSEYGMEDGGSVKYVDYGKATERSAGILNGATPPPRTAEDMGAATRAIAGPYAPSPLAVAPSGPPPGAPPPGMPGAGPAMPGGGAPMGGMNPGAQMAGLPPRPGMMPPPGIPGRPGAGPMLQEEMLRYAA